jgi:hypothetical protein
VLQIENTTPFVPGMFLFPDGNGVDTLYVVLKATFAIRGGRVRIGDVQRPIVLVDTWNGKPGQSSIRFATEAHLAKRATDVILVGEAFAPHERPIPSCLVAVTVGPVRKVIQVLGDRTWRTGLSGLHMTAPEPFLRMPLVYERAFGGAVTKADGKAIEEARNPIGRGLWNHRGAAEIEGAPLPNLEDPAHLIGSLGDRPSPAGLGFIAPAWEPRRSLAGTYDAAWVTTRAPYLPKDFDPRFFQTASAGLTCSTPLRGGEPVETVNASPEGAERYRLPTCVPAVEVDVAGNVIRPPMALETVVLEPGEARLSLTFRGAVPCDKTALRARSVRVGLSVLSGVEGGS